MKIAIAALLLATGCTITMHEDPKLLEAVYGVQRSVDALSAKVQPAQAQQPAKHLVCRAKDALELPADDRKEGDIEMPVRACAPPDEQAPCVNGVPLSNVIARCKAGKL